ncbi:hypothetical protein ACROYT_G030663 [Oculina patagonica]
MADTYLRCDECSKKLKTFQALLKHFEQQHVSRRLPRRAKFLQNDEEVQMPIPEAIRSPLQAHYKAWLMGITERINGVHHQRHRRNWQTLEFNMVPSSFFQQLLRNLKDPQPNAVRNQQHWRAPILCPSSKKVTYRFFDLETLEAALGKQNTVALQKQVQWNGDKQVTDYLSDMDPREALAAAKNKAHGKAPKRQITCRSNLVVGHGEGRATRELDLIWWPNLYNTPLLGKMCIRLYVNRVQL